MARVNYYCFEMLWRKICAFVTGAEDVSCASGSLTVINKVGRYLFLPLLRRKRRGRGRRRRKIWDQAAILIAV